MTTALFITFEGPEGSGKSVQTRRLAESLRSLGWDVVETREPGGTPLGNAVRGILLDSDEHPIAPESEALLLSAARFQHVQDVIRPALANGSAVISDRYADSTLAYQGGGHGVPLETLQQLQAFATGGLEPTLRILLDVPVEVGLRRRFGDEASVNRIDRAPVAFHERVRAMFLRLADADPNGWAVIDGTADVETVAENVHTVVKTRVLARLAPAPHTGDPLT